MRLDVFNGPKAPMPLLEVPAELVHCGSSDSYLSDPVKA